MSRDGRVIKSFGTILNSNSHVKVQASRFKTAKKKIDKVIPATFNPFDTWGNYLSDIKNQGGCGCCWAMASSSAMADRLTIMTLGQFFEALSPYQMIICQGAIPPKDGKVDPAYIQEINHQAHSQGSCNGNSLYSAMDFLYCFGLTTTRCVNEGEFPSYNIKKIEEVQEKDIPICQDILGDNYDTCLDKKIASRFYRTIAGYAVDPDVESIKQEIYKWGPVISGFQVFDNFLNDYDGIGIYMGPPKDSKETSVGGHAIKILGWGKEKDKKTGEVIDFWWIANSWGASWGKSGYFRMAMNIKECQLEQNVVAFIPDLIGFKLEYSLYTVSVDQTTDFIRSWFKVDPVTGYKYSSIKKIREGTLAGNLNDFICKYEPNFKNMWVGEMTLEDMEAFSLKLKKQYGVSSFYWIGLFLILVICYIAGYGLRLFLSSHSRHKRI